MSHLPARGVYEVPRGEGQPWWGVSRPSDPLAELCWGSSEGRALAWGPGAGLTSSLSVISRHVSCSQND